MSPQESLFPPARKSSRGPIYQGVAKQIRALIAADVVDRDRQAGTIAQARQLAHVLDIKSGHFDPAQSEYGASIAAMHKQLDELLARLAGDDVDGDPFDELLKNLGADQVDA